MTDKIECRSRIKGSAYEVPYALHRHICEAIDGLRNSKALREALGDEFVTLFCAVKEHEHREFQERVPVWETGELATLV